MAYFTTQRDENIVYFRPSHIEHAHKFVQLVERPKEPGVHDCYVCSNDTIDAKFTGLDVNNGIELCRQKVYEVQGLEAQFPQEIIYIGD